MTDQDRYWADCLALFMLDHAEDRIEYPALRIVAYELGMDVSEEDANAFAENHTQAQRILTDPDGAYYDRCEELGGVAGNGEDRWGWAQDKAAELDADNARICLAVAQRRCTGMRLSIFDRAS